MKILSCSDIHISDFLAHSTRLENGFNNRLFSFTYLAQDILEVAEQNNVDVVIIAGDLCHSSKITPEELEVTDRFLKTITSNKDISVIIIPGNHDLSTKTEFSPEHRCIFSPVLRSRDNYFPIYSPTILNIKGTTFHIAPWSLVTFNEFTPCDVFVGHGSVVGK